MYAAASKNFNHSIINNGNIFLYYYFTLSKKGTKKIRRSKARKKALRIEKDIQTLAPEELNELKSEINRVLKKELSNEDAVKGKSIIYTIVLFPK